MKPFRYQALGTTMLLPQKPVAVRFAFSNTALPNLLNRAGLPASAFRTDDWDIEFAGK